MFKRGRIDAVQPNGLRISRRERAAYESTKMPTISRAKRSGCMRRLGHVESYLIVPCDRTRDDICWRIQPEWQSAIPNPATHNHLLVWLWSDLKVSRCVASIQPPSRHPYGLAIRQADLAAMRMAAHCQVKPVGGNMSQAFWRVHHDDPRPSCSFKHGLCLRSARGWIIEAANPDMIIRRW